MRFATFSYRPGRPRPYDFRLRSGRRWRIGPPHECRPHARAANCDVRSISGKFRVQPTVYTKETLSMRKQFLLSTGNGPRTHHISAVERTAKSSCSLTDKTRMFRRLIPSPPVDLLTVNQVLALPGIFAATCANFNKCTKQLRSTLRRRHKIRSRDGSRRKCVY